MKKITKAMLAACLLSPVTTNITGTHDLFFVFKGLVGRKLFNFDWWQFKK